MKKKIALLLSAIMMLSMLQVSAAGGKVTPRMTVKPATSQIIFSSTALQTRKAVGLTGQYGKVDVVAQRFYSEDVVNTLEFGTVSFANDKGGFTVKLYQWNESYEKTLKGEIIQQESYLDFRDSAKLTFNIDKQVKGDLLLAFDTPVEDVGLYTNDFNTVNTGEFALYFDGIEQPGRALQIVAYNQKIYDRTVNGEAISAYSQIDLSKPVISERVEFNEENKFVTAYDSNASFVAYKVDFGDTAPKGATLRVQSWVTDAAKVQIIADDIEKGDVIAEFYLEIKQERPWLTNLTSKIHKDITGVHDIYVVFEKNINCFWLEFSKTELEPSWDETRLNEFKASNKFELNDTYSDTWTATDLLGRKLVDNQTAGDYNPDKQVGMFYWTWHADTRQNKDIAIIQRTIDLYDGPESDIKSSTSYKGWKYDNFWNESIYGTYSGYDHWVLRKQLELFAAAGVDGLFFDATNNEQVYTSGYMNLAQTIHDMHLDGIKTPGIAFMLPFYNMDYNVTDLERIYESMYSIGLYSDTWYYWEGKPVVMGYADNLVKTAENEQVKAQHEEIKDFFTFRGGQARYIDGPTRDGQWPWLEVYPQYPYGTSEKYGCECVTVGVAMNYNGKSDATAMNGKDVYGRSYTYKDRFAKLSDTSKYYGYNFSEQWDRAFELDPEFVFVTGWNEWIVGHAEEWAGVIGAFADTYNDEYSRDLEPTKGELKDTYYLLLANKIRQFKGVRPTPTATEEKTIDLNAGFDQWQNVGPEFIGYVGGTEARDSHLLQGNTPVKNTTGRNDIVLSKVARDSENLYFYVQTKDNLTSHTDKNWMRLFINTDRTYKTGWEGYDFVLNRVSPNENKAVLEKWSGKAVADWYWETAGEVEYTYSGNQMMIKIPKAMLGISGSGIDIEFKWNDNMQIQGDIMDFYVNGDTAPVGRYAYRYVDEANAKNTVKDEPVDPAQTLTHILKSCVIMQVDNNVAIVCGHKTPIDNASNVTSPMIINDKTMVPVRFLSESLGANVEWEDETKTVKITIVDKRITLTLDSNIMKIDKVKHTLQTPATEVENRIYVPLRDIVEAVGMECVWMEPGIIICAPSRVVPELYVNGGIERVIEEYAVMNNN